MNQEERLINGELLRLRREAQGWVITDMALRACLSVKQVRQLEEGGTSAFYSESVKLTAAKKVGGLLGLSADEVFVTSATPLVEAVVQEPEIKVVEPHADAVDAADESKAQLVTEAPSVTESAPMPAVASVPVGVDPKPKTSLWLIAGLFAAALAVAAYLQPKEEAPVEAAPPLQVVPSEAEGAASTAEAAASSASAASEPAAPVAQKVASTPSVPASVAVPAAASAASKAH